MRYTPNSTPTAVGPDGWFTGTVYLDKLRDPDSHSAIGSSHVRFAPGSRTFWHTHPKGQTLYVTDGVGWVATRDRLQRLLPGDVVYIEPGEEHWHGAAVDRFMAHVAMQEADAHGTTVTWLAPVGEEDYPRG